MSMKNYKLAKRHRKKDMSYANQRLPSHIRCWLKELGWKMPRERSYGAYAERRGRYLRILFAPQPAIRLIQICDGDFDRWANSVGAQIGIPQWPKTKIRLKQIIETLKTIHILGLQKHIL